MLNPMHSNSSRWATVQLDPETERQAALATHALLKRIKELAETARAEQRETELSWQISFDEFNPDHIDFILATIGTGEVRILLDEGRVKAEETGIPALWRVQEDGKDSFVLSLLPSVVGRAIDSLPETLTIPSNFPQDVFAAPSILAELKATLEKTDVDTLTHDPAYSVELTRQPLIMNDRPFMQEVLGEGSIEVSMTGFASAYIRNTKVRGIWHSKLLNNAGKPLMDSYVVARIPPEVPAAPEEIDDTVRLAEETMTWIHDDLERGALG